MSVYHRALRAYVLLDGIAALHRSIDAGAEPWKDWPPEMDARLRNREGYLELLEAAHEQVTDAIEAQYVGLPPLPAGVSK